MEKFKCPDCDTKIRKFSDGFICKNNHKFLPGSKIHTKISETNKLIKDVNTNPFKTTICPVCYTGVVSMCKCINSEMECINNHIWTRKYYEGDKRYLYVGPPHAQNMHVFDNLS